VHGFPPPGHAGAPAVVTHNVSVPVGIAPRAGRARGLR
jgi:hypothetical protein